MAVVRVLACVLVLACVATGTEAVWFSPPIPGTKPMFYLNKDYLVSSGELHANIELSIYNMAGTVFSMADMGYKLCSTIFVEPERFEPIAARAFPTSVENLPMLEAYDAIVAIKQMLVVDKVIYVRPVLLVSLNRVAESPCIYLTCGDIQMLACSCACLQGIDMPELDWVTLPFHPGLPDGDLLFIANLFAAYFYMLKKSTFLKNVHCSDASVAMLDLIQTGIPLPALLTRPMYLNCLMGGPWYRWFEYAHQVRFETEEARNRIVYKYYKIWREKAHKKRIERLMGALELLK